jgi:hypothetical protein
MLGLSGILGRVTEAEPVVRSRRQGNKDKHRDRLDTIDPLGENKETRTPTPVVRRYTRSDSNPKLSLVFVS